MPTLGRKIIIINLPSSTEEDPAYVKVYDSVVAGDYDDIDPNPDKPRDTMYAIYAKIIQEWNFKDENNVVYPITMDNCRLLKSDDLAAIREATSLSKQLDTLKKNS